VFLAEKYASKLEIEVMQFKRDLKIPIGDDEQFLFPIELIAAMENRQAVEDFLWAGLLGAIRYIPDTEAIMRYAITVDTENPLYIRTDEEGDLPSSLLAFATNREGDYALTREKVNRFVIEKKRGLILEDKLNGFLDPFMKEQHPLNRFVLRRQANEHHTVLAEYHRIVSEYSLTEMLEVPLKLMLLKQIRFQKNLFVF